MTDGGITIENLMKLMQEMQEAGMKHKVSGDQHIMHLFALMAFEAELEFGADGLRIVEHAVTRFGVERGQRIAGLVKEAGRPLTLMNFFLYNDLDTSGNEMVPELVDGEFHIRVMKCRLADKLKGSGLERYGKFYCINIDTAMLRGYNPKLQLEIRSQLTRGADCCHFIYRQPSEAVSE